MNAPTIAIIGSGPAGCYTAQALRKQWPTSEIAIIDKLPVPFGLIRYGVAPDHVGTKAVTRQFARLFERDNIQFIGNLEIGKDLELDDLKAAFDIVVIATGLYGDKKLAIVGQDLQGIYGAGRLTRLWNDHPDEVDFQPNLGERVVVVGNGNVAIDIIRLLTKTVDQFFDSELSPESLSLLQKNNVKTIDIVGRSPISLAKFDTVMIRELAKLTHVTFKIGEQTNIEQLASSTDPAKLEALLSIVENSINNDNNKQITFHFGWQPEQIKGKTHVQEITFCGCDAPHKKLQLTADSVITAIGFEDHPQHPLKRTSFISEQQDTSSGRLSEGLYCVGWFKRGPRGTIPENRMDAKQVAETIINDVTQQHLILGKAGFATLITKLKQPTINYDHWKIIDLSEQQRSPEGRQRHKFRDKATMLAIIS